MPQLKHVKHIYINFDNNMPPSDELGYHNMKDLLYHAAASMDSVEHVELCGATIQFVCRSVQFKNVKRLTLHNLHEDSLSKEPICPQVCLKITLAQLVLTSLGCNTHISSSYT